MHTDANADAQTQTQCMDADADALIQARIHGRKCRCTDAGTDTRMQTQLHRCKRRCTRMRTNTNLRAFFVCAGELFRRIQPLDVRSKTFGLHYNIIYMFLNER